MESELNESHVSSSCDNQTAFQQPLNSPEIFENHFHQGQGLHLESRITIDDPHLDPCEDNTQISSISHQLEPQMDQGTRSNISSQNQVIESSHTDDPVLNMNQNIDSETNLTIGFPQLTHSEFVAMPTSQIESHVGNESLTSMETLLESQATIQNGISQNMLPLSTDIVAPTSIHIESPEPNESLTSNDTVLESQAMLLKVNSISQPKNCVNENTLPLPKDVSAIPADILDAMNLNLGQNDENIENERNASIMKRLQHGNQINENELIAMQLPGTGKP